MPRSDVLMVGATGLVGSLALPGLLQQAAAERTRVHVLSRRALPIQHPQLRLIQADFDLVLANPAAHGLDHQTRLQTFVCTLGSTLRAAGSATAFAAIDRDLVLSIAKLARSLGATQAVVVSSVGASARSGNLYLRVKGEMEQGIAAIGFERIDFLHPGLLLGQRDGERRPGERIAQALAPLYNPFLLGPLAAFAAIDAQQVANALVALVGRSEAALTRWDNRLLRLLAREAL